MEDEMTITNNISVIYFGASWCGPCRILGPVFSEWADENKGINITKLDIDENKEKANAYSVRSIPTILFLKGDEVIERLVGTQPKKKLQMVLDSIN